jgi:hypothetical protein
MVRQGNTRVWNSAGGVGHAHVLMTVSARTRSGLLIAKPRPVGPPQSWQTTVRWRRSSWRTRPLRFAIWPSEPFVGDVIVKMVVICAFLRRVTVGGFGHDHGLS